MSRKFTLASQLAQHVLHRDGPLTTHRLYRACLAEDAPVEQSYRQPGHREWRLIGDTIVAGTTPPPNPDHLVRSVKFLKQNMRELSSYGKVGHTTIDNWIADCERANIKELADEGKVAKKAAEEEKDSPRVWVDYERYIRVKGEGSLVPKPIKKKYKKKEINPKFLQPRAETYRPRTRPTAPILPVEEETQDSHR